MRVEVTITTDVEVVTFVLKEVIVMTDVATLVRVWVKTDVVVARQVVSVTKLVSVVVGAFARATRLLGESALAAVMQRSKLMKRMVNDVEAI